MVKRDYIKIKVSDLKSYEKNNKKHWENIDQIVKSIQANTYIAPIIIDENNVILAWHWRKLALDKLQVTEAEVLQVSWLSEEQKRDFRIRDNKLTELSERDFENLKFELDELDIPDLSDLFKDEEELKVEPEAEEDDYVVPETITTDIVVWDLFEIGSHRLLCGDSTNIDDVNKLMNWEKADISFTSPPYNAWTTPTEVKMWKKSKYANDSDNKSEDQYLKLLIDFTNNTLIHSEYSFVNIQSLSWNKIALIDFLYNMKDVYADTIIWQKQNAQPAMAENVLNSQYEYIHIFSYKANRAIWTKKFRWTLSNVLEISKQTKNEVKEHNATFPMEFASHFISNFCENSVLDLFGWSWTTMVACHQLNRRCYMSELDPKYVQTIINRMIKLDPTLEIKKNWAERDHATGDYTLLNK